MSLLTCLVKTLFSFFKKNKSRPLKRRRSVMRKLLTSEMLIIIMFYINMVMIHISLR